MTDKDKIIEMLRERGIEYREVSNYVYKIELRPEYSLTCAVKFVFDACYRLIKIESGSADCVWN